MLRRSSRALRALRRQASVLLLDSSFRGLAHIGKLHPRARPHRHRVEVLHDVPYLPTGRAEHTLDVYRPTDVAPGERLPMVLYVHGGGFRILSKDTHWVMGLAFARRGYLVFNINYRLAPRHRFPAGLADCCAAYAWLCRSAAAFGGDLGRLALAGESAGANLVTALAIAASYRRPEPYAREVFDTGVVPAAVVPACGILQVSRPERFAERKDGLPGWLNDYLLHVAETYIGGGNGGELADPLLQLERGRAPDRPLPPFFVPVGTKDPLLDDSRRLKAALDRLGAPCEASYYPGEVHAFHAMVWRAEARRCWQETYDFLDRHLAPAKAAAAR
jgi:acetyl esterase